MAPSRLWLLVPLLSAERCDWSKDAQDTPHLQLVQRQLQLRKSRKVRTWDEARDKAAELVPQLSAPELHQLLRGEHFAVTGEPDAGYYVGNIAGVPRLGLPALKMQDAGQGFRATEPKTGGTTTAFPCMLALASTWDEELVELVAAAIATEFKGKGANVVLGPSINVHRVAAGGRNFEYLSGEDGHLGARLTAAYVKGVQDQGVMAVAKHFAFNEQETKRMLMDAHASERSKWELYYAPFRAAVEAGVGAVMCAYNKVNGTYACHNSEILTNDLRSKMGFHGFVMSDWLAMHSPEALAAGLDQEQPGLINLPFGNKYGILSDKVITGLDRKVKEGAARHILTSVFRLGLDLEPGCAPPNCTKELTSDQTKAITKGQSHGAIAFRAAASAVTLLKNTNSLLPLSKGKVHRIAVVGKACHDAAHASYIGKGSGFVQPDSSARTPFQAIKERASKDEIEVVKPEGDTAAEAAALASSADLVIVVIGADASEGADRSSLDLGLDNDALVRGVTSKAPTVVLLQIPGAVLLPWRAEVNAIASIFMGGVATGAAWASFLFGDSPPRGRLPIMMPATAADTIPVGDVEVDYSEGLLTSYRSPRLKAAYPFGHGLTFTSFEFSGAKQLACPNVACVSVGIKNLGHGSGEEVVQAYVHFPSPQGGDDRWVQSTPAMVLKKFQRTKVLQPNESQLLRLDFSPEDFSLFSSERGWVPQSKVEVWLGASSRDIRAKVLIEVSS